MTEHLLSLKTDAPLWNIQNKGLLRTYLYLLTICNKELVVPIPVISKIIDRSHLDYLTEKDYIIKIRGGYSLGEVSAKSTILFANELNPLLNELETITRLADDYKKRSIKKHFVFDAIEELVTYCTNPETVQDRDDLMRIWRSYYALMYSREARVLTSKEIGQFMHLERFYGAINSAKMIILYMTEATSPNIGELLVKKDKYFHKFVEKTEAETKKEEVNDEGFF